MNARDRARARVGEAGGPELLERLDHLDARAFLPPLGMGMPPAAPRAGDRRDVDVVIGGGGLWLLLAPILASKGLRVMICDRAVVGAAHREWNAGQRELFALAQTGLFSRAKVDALVVARYQSGVCRWHRGRSHPVRGVLDVAIDARALLIRARSLAEAAGVEIVDGVEVTGLAEGPSAVRVSLRDRKTSATSTVTAAIFVDGRGASSPFARADLACPTVGGVMRGLERGSNDRGAVDPRVGEILATTEDVEEGRQHLWEAFPGRDGETTVYLFHYARAENTKPGDLVELYARFFSRLASYKRGPAELLRPTFGVIPGWSRLGPAPRAPGRRVLLVGDAAARHSPLTFCGFGASIRSLTMAATSIADAIERGGSISLDDAALHTGTGALAMMLASPPRDPERARDLNDLLEAAFSTLDELGERAYGDLLRDEMSPGAFVGFLRRTAARRSRVYRDVLATIGPGAVTRWAFRLASEVARA